MYDYEIWFLIFVIQLSIDILWSPKNSPKSIFWDGNQQSISSLGWADHYIGLIMKWEYEQACLKKFKCQAPWSSLFRLWLSRFQEYPFPLGICRALLSSFGKAANGPWWGRAIHTKPHGVALKSLQINAPPRHHTKIAFSISCKCCIYRKSVLNNRAIYTRKK